MIALGCLDDGVHYRLPQTLLGTAQFDCGDKLQRCAKQYANFKYKFDPKLLLGEPSMSQSTASASCKRLAVPGKVTISKAEAFEEMHSSFGGTQIPASGFYIDLNGGVTLKHPKTDEPIKISIDVQKVKVYN